MKIRWVIGAAVLVGAVGLVAPAVAASSMPLQNGTFACSGCATDNVAVGPGFYDISSTTGANDMAGWTVTENSVDVIETYWETPPGGGNSLDMNGTTNGTIQQTFPTVSGATYFVSFELSGNPDGGPVTKTLDVSATGGASQTYSFDDTGITHTDMGWTPEGYSFVASGATTTLTFAGGPSNDTAYGPVLGYVTVTQVAASGAQCKDGGWQMGIVVNNELVTFTNQGQCVAYFATTGQTPIGS